MSSAALSMLAFGAYLALGGGLLLFVPADLCRLLGLRPPGDPFWVRLSGMFFLCLAFYCVKAARSEQKQFMRWSVFTRPLTLPILGVCVYHGYENAIVLSFGIIDVLAAFWTGVTLVREKTQLETLTPRD